MNCVHLTTGSKNTTFLSMVKKIRFKIPSPLALAIILSFTVYALALIFTKPSSNDTPYPLQLLDFYQRGFWDLLAFSMQMMLILVLGNVLALTPFFQRIIQVLLNKITSHATAILFTAFFSLLLGLFNWGLGLIFSALLARAIGGHARKSGMKLNYPLLVAAAYTGMMVWHGGFSGSAPLKVAESGHFLQDKIGVIPVSETLLSSLNLGLNGFLLMVIPLSLVLISRWKKSSIMLADELPEINFSDLKPSRRQYTGFALGLALVVMAVYQFFQQGISALNINLINLMLLALGLLLYKNLHDFMKAVNMAIVSSSGIMIQFPIYAGIMGLMNYSGLAAIFTQSLVSVSSASTLPVMGFISAAVVNFFVPSGGGQWAVQGPILMDAALQLGASVPKTIMALAYGDELTNMIQPFWAIPLLAITGVKARSILPYTFIIMLVGGMSMAVFLMVF